MLVIDQVLVIIGVTVLVMISPGPDRVIVMRNTILGGRVAGMQTSLGVFGVLLVTLGLRVALLNR